MAYIIILDQPRAEALPVLELVEYLGSQPSSTNDLLYADKLLNLSVSHFLIG